jgi:hypothetical protein
MQLLKNLALFGSGIVCLAILIVATIQYLDRPMVYTSTITQQCVRVEVAPGRKPLSCVEVEKEGNYDVVWVK